MRIIQIGALIAALILPNAVFAQSTPFAPAIVVNEDMVTYYDLSQRVALYRAFGRGAEQAQTQATADLTEEALMRQEATRLGVMPSDAQIEAAYENYAQRRQTTPAALTGGLRQAGIDRQTLLNQIAAQIGWRNAMQSRFTSRALPNTRDIEQAVVQSAAESGREVLLLEIAIPFFERGENATTTLIQRLYTDLSAGGDFRAAAREYSRTGTRSSGGEIGWIAADDLPAQMRAAVDVLEVGDVSRPLPITRGVSLLKVADERQIAASDNSRVTLSYARASFPITTSEADARTAATRARNGLNTCADVDAQVGTFGPGSGRFGPSPLAAVDTSLFSVLATAQVGAVSQPVRIGDTVSIVILCSRNVAISEDERRIVADQIFADRVTAYADGFMQELRRDAVIEYR